MFRFLNRDILVGVCCLLFSAISVAELRVSSNADRSNSTALSQATLSDRVYIYYDAPVAASQVRFYLDQSDSGTIFQTENKAPYDFAGTASNGDGFAFATETLSDGQHFITVSVTPTTGAVFTEQASFTVDNSDGGSGGGGGGGGTPSSYTLQFSDNPGRTGASALAGQTLEGDGYVFIAPETDVNEVRFYVNSDENGTAQQIERSAPYDLGGTESNDDARPFNFDTLGQGNHFVTAEIFTGTGIEVISASFSVGAGSPLLQATTTDVNWSVEEGGPAQSSQLTISSSTGAAYTLQENHNDAWLSVAISGSTPSTVTLTGNPSGLSPGSYEDTVTFSATGHGSVSVSVQMLILPASGGGGSGDYQMLISGNANRSGATALAGQGVSGDIYVFISPETDISEVRWYLDDPQLTSPVQTERKAPYDFAGTEADDTAKSFNSDGLSAGTHSVTALVVTSDGTKTVTGSFVTGSGLPQLQSTVGTFNWSADVSDPAVTGTTVISTSDGSTASLSESHGASWLDVSLDSNSTPSTVTFMADPSGLSEGSYQDTVVFSAVGYGSVSVNVNLQVSDNDGNAGGGGGDCFPVSCELIKVSIPFSVEFDQEQGGLEDGAGTGTGMTYLQPSTKGGYKPNLLDVNTSTERLVITTTSGLQYTSTNSLDNAIGVGYAGPNYIARISTVLVDPPTGTGSYEQAGLWFGYDEDNYVKLVFLSGPSGGRVQFGFEDGGSFTTQFNSTVGDLNGSTIKLILVANPENKTLTGRYSVNGGAELQMGVINLPSEFFSFDAAGIDPIIGTRTFTGLMASNRNGSALNYQFENFLIEEVDEGGGGPLPGSGDWQFVKSGSHNVSFPTSMVWGPNGKLYVATLQGEVRELTYDDDFNVIQDNAIDSLQDSLGNRLTLGIEVYHDNPSDPDDFSLWLNHSSASANNGDINSGMVTRLSGNNFQDVEHVIEGLPRAKANHGPNSLHFGPDGKLYIAIGGITGAGAAVDPNIAPSEFGDRAEQYLSASILVADVFEDGFDGTCANNSDIFGLPPCDVDNWVTGLRNTYDFVFHSNGEAYATDNGLGVTGAFPPKPTPDCSGFGDPDPYDEGGDNPGAQPDLLLRLLEGKYYGHPNPSRDECVFKDGSFQGVSALSNYEEEIFDLGDNRSANGIIEYRSSRACGALTGNLMYTNYSKDDGVVRVVLNESGTAVESSEKIFADLDDPLVLSERDGNLYIGEFGNGKVSVLELIASGCWLAAEDAPAALLDPGSTIMDGQLYLVGGKTSAGHTNNHYAYDIDTDTWQTLNDKPGPAVENPAVAAFDGMLYVFGGSTAPFSGAVSNSYRYNPGNDSWETLTSMPTALGGIRAEVIGDKIYIAGGMNGSGASVNSLLIYDPDGDSWQTGPSMSQVRDNPGTAVIDGKLYVMGGRERQSNGTTVDGTLNSMEIYTPGSGWSSGASMNVGRRTFAVGTVDGNIQVVGGEVDNSSSSGVFEEVEVYDTGSNSWSVIGVASNPTHGSGFGTYQGQLVITVGGEESGSSFTNNTHLISFE